MSFTVKFLTAGDCGLVVEFGDIIDEKINARVHLLAHFLSGEEYQHGITELVPTYRSLLVAFAPLVVSRQELIALIKEHLGQEESVFEEASLPKSSRIVELPVCYGGEFGPDLLTVAEHSGFSIDEVINIHSSGSYKVYMLGFLPGFPYLGGLDGRIACPRLKTPRIKVPAGSVGIAGNQTGAYPVESPGGWQLIGRTPLPLFDGTRKDTFLVRPGDTIIFKPVGEGEYERILSELAVAVC